MLSTNGKTITHMLPVPSGGIHELTCQSSQLSAEDVILLYNFQNTIYPLSYCASTYKHAMNANPAQVYINQMHQKLTPEFRAIFDDYWSKFASDASDAINAIGVVPYTMLMTHNGFEVPHVLIPGTYKLSWRHCIQSERLVFDVIRTSASGISFINQHSTKGDLLNESESVEAGQLAALLNGDQGLLGARSSDSSSMSQVTGPTSGDPHELLTRRIDMGRSVPTLGQPDPCCMVLSGFGFDPSLDGRLNSNAAALWPEYIKVLMHEHMNITQESRITEHVPFAEVPEPSDEYINSLTTDVVGPTSLNQAMGDNQGVQRVILSQQEVSRREMLRNAHRTANSQKRLASLNLPDLQDMMHMRPSQSYAMLREYMRQTYVDSVHEQMLGHYELLQPGAHLSNYAPHVSSVHMPAVIQLFHTKVSAQYQVPISAITQRTSTAGDSTQQREAKYESINWMIKRISSILTTIFQTLYGEQEMNNAFSYLYNRFLSQEAIERLISDFDRACENNALQQVMRANRILHYALGPIVNTSGSIKEGTVATHEYQGSTDAETINASKRKKNSDGDSKSKRKNNALRSKLKSNEDDTEESESSDDDSDAEEKERIERKRDIRKARASAQNDYGQEGNDDEDSSEEHKNDSALYYDQDRADQATNYDQYEQERRGAWVSLWLKNPDDKRLLSQNLQDIVNDPDRETARLRLRMMYLENLRRLNNEQRRQLLVEGDTRQREWYSKRVGKMQEQAAKATDIQVTLIYSAPIDLSQLTFMGMMGLLNPHEYATAARSRYMLPVQCDSSEAQRQTKMLEQLTKLMCSTEVQNMVSDTPMGTMMRAVEGQLFNQQQKLSGENTQLHDQIDEQRLEMAIEKAVHRITLKMEKEYAKEQGEKHGEKQAAKASSSSSTTTKSGDSSSSKSSESSSTKDTAESASEKSEAPTSKPAKSEKTQESSETDSSSSHSNSLKGSKTQANVAASAKVDKTKSKKPNPGSALSKNNASKKT